MNKRFIKMNNNKDYLSLGNLVNIIKNNSKVKESSIQTQVFCSIFNICNINNTTVNNYLIGYRAIGLEYKKIYIDLKEEYKVNKLVFLEIICNIMTILEEKIYRKDSINIETINSSIRLKHVCSDLIELSTNDFNVSLKFKNEVKSLYDNNNIYECIIKFLIYTILENKQPIFNSNINIDYNNKELEEYLKINLYEGISYISSLLELSRKDNMYANAELGSLEYSGLIDGNVDYEKSYEYYKKAALKNHPKACWMVANLILMNKVKEKSINIMWDYLNQALKLGSIAAINTLGKCYMNGINPNSEVDEKKAIEYFLKASEMGYSYSYNNLGLYYEKNKDYKTALKFFKLSADLYNSWALNKVGEYLRKDNKLEDAYFYYINSIKTPINERNYYGYYNLAKYYFLIGNKELNIKKDIKKAIEYLKIANENGVTKSIDELNNI